MSSELEIENNLRIKMTTLKKDKILNYLCEYKMIVIPNPSIQMMN